MWYGHLKFWCTAESTLLENVLKALNEIFMVTLCANITLILFTSGKSWEAKTEMETPQITKVLKN